MNNPLSFPVIFTDLDGTLLDHETYSYLDAQASLDELREAQIPVVPVTSKTAPEVSALLNKLSLNGPFVIENGAAIYLPSELVTRWRKHTNIEGLAGPLRQLDEEYWVKAFSPDRSYWQTLISELSYDFPDTLKTFSQLGNEGIKVHTGLGHEQAALANDRGYSEPVLWLGDSTSKQRFVSLVREKGYKVLEGGRFLHITSGYDKGQALSWLQKMYQADYPDSTVRSYALGDSHNDLEMLLQADVGMLIRSPAHPFPDTNELLLKSKECGPAGWHELIQEHLLQQYRGNR